MMGRIHEMGLLSLYSIGRPVPFVAYIWMNRKYTAEGAACRNTIKPVPSLSGHLPLLRAMTAPKGMPMRRERPMAIAPSFAEILIFGLMILTMSTFSR